MTRGPLSCLLKATRQPNAVTRRLTKQINHPLLHVGRGIPSPNPASPPSPRRLQGPVPAMEPSPTSSLPAVARRLSPEVRRVRKRALEEVLEQVQRAVEMLRDADADLGVSLSGDTAAAPPEGEDRRGDVGVDGDDVATSSVASDSDYETAQVSKQVAS